MAHSRLQFPKNTDYIVLCSTFSVVESLAWQAIPKCQPEGALLLIRFWATLLTSRIITALKTELYIATIKKVLNKYYNDNVTDA